jgi:hypothetical protein
MAAPHVSGVAALVWSQLLENDPSNSNALANRDEVIRRLRDCADQTGAMGQNMLIWSEYGRLNAHGAVTCGGGTVIDNPPSVSIFSPDPGASFDSGTPILFAGSASDPEDGDLTASLEWKSDRDGSFGTGGSFSEILSDGTHVITASVSDTGGSTGSNFITITVNNSVGGGIILSATGYKLRGSGYADLIWTGATSENVNVYRNGTFLMETLNAEGYTDGPLGNGSGSATYQVCDGTICSNIVTVNW